MTFPESVVTAVLAHMNDDHNDDSLLIVRAFARPDATAAAMTGLDGEAGVFAATTPDGNAEVRVAWPAGTISERAEIRREVVALYDAACARLGVAPRPH
ncbi:DUF2470 domain-containing protein [Nocardioides lianchengensis]|uniref:Uncharacterized protein n=1 Tax=Nocardioides lianchengensis TaxID=1045774 RepID=A0A1G6M0C0_9ACTN|nr:DUF2470 domain-containing protein [Nocardioides lianchengensis]NYG12392.1 hypothetical protein [Nocardioides lianchengensis]SDC48891.1 Protein of unknown function [Nocardioides lianchengensis]